MPDRGRMMLVTVYQNTLFLSHADFFGWRKVAFFFLGMKTHKISKRSSTDTSSTFNNEVDIFICKHITADTNFIIMAYVSLITLANSLSLDTNHII